MPGYAVSHIPLTNIVNTRCVYYRHDKLPETHKDNMTLAPFIDMINHSPLENIRVSRVEGDLEIRSICPIDANEEIVFSYHSESSRFWLCEYGFWLEGNVFDDLDLSAEIEEIVRQKEEWLEQEGYWGYFSCPCFFG